MSKRNINFILIIIYLSSVYSFPFYNLQSTELSNGEKLVIHKYGIDICDSDFIKIIRNEIVFSSDEQISTEDKLNNAIIKKFDDGYIICLINNKAYLFDELGNFLCDRGSMNLGYISNYYSLNIKDNYHFFVGLISNDYFYLYYYEYDKSINKIQYLFGFENFQVQKSWNLISTTYYSYKDGLNCHMMKENEESDETLACFYLLYGDNKYYWYIKFFNINENNVIEENTNISPIKEESLFQYTYFKVDVNSEKNIALICGYLSVGADACFYFDFTQKKFDSNIHYLHDIATDVQCDKKNYGLKVNYFSEKNQFIFSCLSDTSIIYVLFYFDDNNSFKYNFNKLNTNDECEYFNGYNFFYSQEEDNYYIISDYICNKSDITDIIETSEKKEEETETTEGYECHLEKCLKCNEISESINLCIKCNQNKGYYPLKSSIIGTNYIDCFNDMTKPENYFFNSNQKYYEPCYEKCAKCEIGGNEINNNCLECDFGYKFLPGLGIENNCYINCPYFFYFTINDQYKCTKSAICPEDYYLLIKDKQQCIANCSKDNEYKYQYDGECYKKCPKNLKENNDFICLEEDINKCSLNKKEIILDNNINIINEREIEKLAKIYVKEFGYTNNHISLFINKDIEIALYKNYKCISDLSLEIPSVNLDNCYTKIQKKYEINDNLIIGVISRRIKENNNYLKIIAFYVYSPYNGNYLNISDVCQNVEIKVQEDISTKIEDKEKYKLVQYLSKQNIDVFNLSSDFYTDICFYFDSPIKKDISLKERIKIFFPNITLCENGCTIKGINSSSMKAECDCKMNNLINNNAFSNNAFYKSQIGDIEELISQINIEILKCSTNIFKYKNIFSYIGTLIIFALIVLQIILTILYYVISVNPLKRYIYSIIDSYLILFNKNENAPPKKENKNKKVKFNNTEISPNKGHKLKKRNKTENEISHKNTNSIKKKKRNKGKRINLTNTSDITKKSNINNYSKDIIIFSQTKSEKNMLKEKEKEKNKLISKNNNKDKLISNNEFGIKIDEYLETDFEDLIFLEVIERDHRTFCQYFKEQLKSNLLIINAILIKEPFKPRVIKFLLFIINIELYLVINALFINEEFINEVYHSKDDNFFSFLPRCIDRIFYTTLIKVFVNYIIDCFFIEEKNIKIILKRKNNNIDDMKIKIKEIMVKTLRRYLYFIIFVFVLSLFSLFYITCFNYRYYYSTSEWIKSSIFIIIFIEIL